MWDGCQWWKSQTTEEDDDDGRRRLSLRDALMFRSKSRVVHKSECRNSSILCLKTLTQNQNQNPDSILRQFRKKMAEKLKIRTASEK